MHQLNVIAFDDADQARELRTAVQRLANEGRVVIDDAVFVTRTPQGRVRVHQTADLTPGAGALAGGFWGLLFGTLLLGPAGGLAVGAATAGGAALMGAVIDAGVPEEFVAQVKDAVAPGSTALILLTSDVDLPALEAELARVAGARLVWSDLPPEARAAVESVLATGEVPDHVEITDEHPGP